MKIIGLLTAFSFTLLGQAADARALNTKTVDIVGLSFFVSVNWETRIVTVRQSNAAPNISEANQWMALQNAVYYASAAGCGMKDRPLEVSGNRTVVTGILDCPWFER